MGWINRKNRDNGEKKRRELKWINGPIRGNKLINGRKKIRNGEEIRGDDKELSSQKGR